MILRHITFNISVYAIRHYYHIIISYYCHYAIIIFATHIISLAITITPLLHIIIISFHTPFTLFIAIITSAYRRHTPLLLLSLSFSSLSLPLFHFSLLRHYDIVISSLLFIGFLSHCFFTLASSHWLSFFIHYCFHNITYIIITTSLLSPLHITINIITIVTHIAVIITIIIIYFITTLLLLPLLFFLCIIIT